MNYYCIYEYKCFLRKFNIILKYCLRILYWIIYKYLCNVCICDEF